MRKIKTNIFFLEELIVILENDSEHITYYKKLTEMKDQSEGCFKIVHRLKEEAPYFQNTLKSVLNHTNIIAELIELK